MLLADPRADSELRWFFADADGDMGLRSNFPAMVTSLQMGGRSGSVTPVSVELNDRWFEAATRSRLCRRALEAIGPVRAHLLFCAFGGCREVAPFGRTTGVVPLTRAARDAHQRSRSARSLEEWLYRLAWRVTHGAPEPEDSERLATISREAERMLLSALGAFASARWGQPRIRPAEVVCQRGAA